MVRRFYGGPVDGELYEVDAATVRTAVDWLTEGMPEPWCLFIPLIFPHPPFAVERKWYERYDGVAMPQPVPPTFDGKPGFYRELHRRCGLDRLDLDDWAELARVYYAMMPLVAAHPARFHREAGDRSDPPSRRLATVCRSTR